MQPTAELNHKKELEQKYLCHNMVEVFSIKE